MMADCCTIRDSRGFFPQGDSFVLIPLPGGYGNTITYMSCTRQRGSRLYVLKHSAFTQGSLSRACDTIECKEDSRSLKEKSVVPLWRGSVKAAPRSFTLFWAGRGRGKRRLRSPAIHS